MAREILLDTAEDMQWLRNAHLPRLSRKYHSALVQGNEDFPDMIVVFRSKSPTIWDRGVIYKYKESVNGFRRVGSMIPAVFGLTTSR